MTTENYCRHCSTTAESMEDLWVNHAACNDAHAASHRDCDHCGKEYPESSLWRDAVGVACDVCHTAHVA